MGVRGLQSFLKDNRQSLCRTVILDPSNASSERIPVVVDAWGVIYSLYLDSLPWTAGGEPLAFYRLTQKLVEAWVQVGLDPTFVFDGASPPEKHDTTLSRLQGGVSDARMFYTISPKTRSTPSFNHGDTAILPPFVAQVFARALKSAGASAHFVPKGEADGMCVVLAAQKGGYVLGRDTDFVILAAGAGEGLKGYAPLDMLEWIDSAPVNDDEPGGAFTTVAPKAKSGRTSRLLPPKQYSQPSLVLATFSSTALCRRLRLPGSLFPLLSSLVGNDYTPAAANDLFFPGMFKPADRIERVASVLREQSARAGGDDHASAAVDLIRRAVRKLCVRPYVSEGDLDNLVDRIIDATMQYVLPPPPCCDSYPFCGELDGGCRVTQSMGTPASTRLGTPVLDSLRLYAAAQGDGYLHNITHAWLYPNRVYLWGVLLENPSLASVRASPEAVAVRRAAYAIADCGLGGLRFPDPTPEVLDEKAQDDAACELLGVGDEETAKEPVPPPRAVTEYVRQGSSTRIIARDIALPEPDDEPAVLRPVEERLRIYLEHLGSDIPAVTALPPQLHPLVAAVRMCIASAVSDQRWKRREVEAVVRAGVGSMELWLAAEGASQAYPSSAATSLSDDTEFPLLTNRNAELAATCLGALLESSILAQSLLLLPDSDDQLLHAIPFVFYSGSAVHSLLSGVEPAWWSAAWKSKYHRALSAVMEGMDELIAPESAAQVKKAKAKKGGAAQPKGETKIASGMGRFGLLAVE